jgi:cytoskeletal protein RodZ
MSSTSTDNGNGLTSFPFNKSDQNNQWPALSIIGVVVTVLAFIAVVWFLFWIFRRENRLRRNATSDSRALESTNRE